MKFFKSTLSNNLRILTIPMPTLESATVTVWSAAGSRLEDKKINGISHFLEHMAFKGGRKYDSAKKVSETIDAIGAEFNAGTSKEWTNFYVKTRKDNLETAFDVLSDMLIHPFLKKEDIEREKGVIVEEIGMYEDTPMYRIGDLFDQLIFEGNSLGWDIAGTKESVRAVKREDFVKYREDQYWAENMLITVAGGVSQGQSEKLAQKYFGELVSKPKKKREYERFKIHQNAPRVLLHNKKIEQAHLIIGFAGNELGSKDRYKEAVLSTILGNGMSSRLFTEVREKRGLAYSVRTGLDHFLDTGTIATYEGVDPKRVDEAIKVTLDEHHALSQGKKKITKEELKKAKEYIKGHIALSLENTRSVNSFFGYEELLLGRVHTPEEEFAGIDKVTAEEVVALSKKLFVKESLNLAIIGPFKDKEKFTKLLQ